MGRHSEKIFVSILLFLVLSFLILASLSNAADKGHFRRLYSISAHSGALKGKAVSFFSCFQVSKPHGPTLITLAWINHHGREHGASCLPRPGSQAHSWEQKEGTVLCTAPFNCDTAVDLAQLDSGKACARSKKKPATLSNLIPSKGTSPVFQIERFPHQVEH